MGLLWGCGSVLMTQVATDVRKVRNRFGVTERPVGLLLGLQLVDLQPRTVLCFGSVVGTGVWAAFQKWSCGAGTCAQPCTSPLPTFTGGGAAGQPDQQQGGGRTSGLRDRHAVQQPAAGGA